MNLVKKISYNDRRLICLSFLLFIPPFLDFIKVLTRGDSSVYTYAVYILSLVYILFVFRKDINIESLVRLSLFFFIFAFSFLAFPETREYYSSDGFILLCAFFLPIISIVVRRIVDWSHFFAIMAWFGVVALVMGVFIVFFSGVDNYNADERYFTYMEFSYAQLPFVCSLYKYSRDNRSVLFFIFFVLGLIEIFALGSRAAHLFTVLFILLTEFFGQSNSLGRLVRDGIVILIFL